MKIKYLFIKTISFLKKIFLLALIALIGSTIYDSICIFHYSLWFSNTCLSTPYSPRKEKELLPILGNEFKYLDQGSTSEAFASLNGDFVVKFFLEKEYVSKKRKYIPIVNYIASTKKKLKLKKKYCEGCINSRLLLNDESGIIYYHFSPTDFLKKSIVFYEKNGERKKIDMDKCFYYIQKKAIVSGDYIHDCIQNGNDTQAFLAITDLLSFTKRLYDQGVVMVDLQLTSNFGFIDGELIRIDTEHVNFRKSWKTAHKTHLKEQLSAFRFWISSNYPLIFQDHFDKEISRLNIEYFYE